LKYISYLVKKGDTLYSIAKKYKTTVNKLKKINNLSNNTIFPGQILKIPVFETNVFESSKNSINEEKQITYYIVKKGDTLYKISKKYGISIKKLKELNHLKTTKIKPGQKLIIYQFYNAEIPSKKDLKEFKKEDFKIYVVKEGDTLYSISLKYNVPLEVLKSLNGIKDNVIFVGQKLKIPYNSLDEEPFVLENPVANFEKPEELLSQKFSINFLSKSIIDEKDENLLKKKFLEISKQYKNYKYKFGGNGNGYLDCSMFVKLVYKELGIELPRTSREQFLVGIDVEKDELIPGDLLFFSRYRNKKRISHVGIYIGDNKFIHFSSSRRGLAIDSLNEPYFCSRFVGAKRIINGEILEQFYRYSQIKNENS
jgi:LysM repeat protein